jgi:hypothetical protein
MFGQLIEPVVSPRRAPYGAPSGHLACGRQMLAALNGKAGHAKQRHINAYPKPSLCYPPTGIHRR